MSEEGGDRSELLRLLGLDSEPLALYAAHHLAGHEGPEVETALRIRLGAAGPELAEAILERLAAYGAAPRAELLAALETGSEIAGVLALRRWGAAVGPELDRLLAPRLARQPPPHVAATMLGVLAEVPGPIDACLDEPLARMLRAEDSRVRANAAELEAARGDGRHDAALEALLEDPVPRVRAAAAKGVWRRDPGAAAARVQADLGGDDQGLLAALHVLGAVPELADAAATLVTHAASPSEQVRLMALRSLAAHSHDLDPAWLAERYFEEEVDACRVAIASRAREGPRALFCARMAAELGGGSDPRRRARAARALGEVGGPEDEARLVPHVTDPDARVRADVVEALGRVGGPGIEPVLEHALSDGAHRVAANAALALWRRGGEEAMGTLVTWLRGQDSGRAASAAFALGEIGSEGVVAPLLEVGERLRDAAADPRTEKGLLDQIMRALAKVRGEGS